MIAVHTSQVSAVGKFVYIIRYTLYRHDSIVHETRPSNPLPIVPTLTTHVNDTHNVINNNYILYTMLSADLRDRAYIMHNRAD